MNQKSTYRVVLCAAILGLVKFVHIGCLPFLINCRSLLNNCSRDILALATAHFLQESGNITGSKPFSIYFIDLKLLFCFCLCETPELSQLPGVPVQTFILMKLSHAQILVHNTGTTEPNILFITREM